DERGAADLRRARRGPVADGEAAVGGEEELPAGGRKVGDARVGPKGAREDRDFRGPGGGPVGLPELRAGGPVVGREEERTAEGGEIERAGVAPRVEGLEQAGAGGGPVAREQLRAAGPGRGLEVEPAVEDGQGRRVRAGRTGVDVRDGGRAG